MWGPTHQVCGVGGGGGRASVRVWDLATHELQRLLVCGGGAAGVVGELEGGGGELVCEGGPTGYSYVKGRGGGDHWEGHST